MKTLILSVFIFVCSQTIGLAQSNDATYFILTSHPTYVSEGISRTMIPSEDLYKTPPIFFRLSSKSKKISEPFAHFDYNPAELSKIRQVKPHDQMKIMTKPLSFLQTIQPIDLDVLLPTMTKEQAETFGYSMRRKTIYIIDRNDITQDSITLIEVRYVQPLKF